MQLALHPPRNPVFADSLKGRWKKLRVFYHRGLNHCFIQLNPLSAASLLLSGNHNGPFKLRTISSVGGTRFLETGFSPSFIEVYLQEVNEVWNFVIFSARPFEPEPHIENDLAPSWFYLFLISETP